MQKFSIALLSVLSLFSSSASARLQVTSATAVNNTVMVFDDAKNNRQQTLNFTVPDNIIRKGNVLVEVGSNSTLAFSSCKFWLTSTTRTRQIRVIGNFPANSTQYMSAFYRYTVDKVTSEPQRLIFRREQVELSYDRATSCNFLGNSKFHAFDGPEIYETYPNGKAVDIYRTTDFLVQAKFNDCIDPAEKATQCIEKIGFQGINGSYGYVDLTTQSFSNGIVVQQIDRGFRFKYDRHVVVVTKNKFKDDATKTASLGFAIYVPRKYISRTDGLCQVFNNKNDVNTQMPARASGCDITTGSFKSKCEYVGDYVLPDKFYTCKNYGVLDNSVTLTMDSASSTPAVSPSSVQTATVDSHVTEASLSASASETIPHQTADQPAATSVTISSQPTDQPTATSVAEEPETTATTNALIPTNTDTFTTPAPPSSINTVIDVTGFIQVNVFGQAQENLEICATVIAEFKKSESFGYDLTGNYEGLEKLCSCRMTEAKDTQVIENMYAVAKEVNKEAAHKCMSSPSSSPASKQDAQKTLDNYKTEESSGKKVNTKLNDLIKQFVEVLSPASAVSVSLSAIIFAQIATLFF